MKIAIIGAMQVEIDLLKSSLSSKTVERVGIFEFYKGEIDNCEVIVLLSGIGKVSSSVATTILIERYNPDFIINTGTAGGLNGSVMGDLVVAKTLSYHDVDLTAFGYDFGQQSGMPLSFETDSKLLKLAGIVCDSYSGSIRKGLIVSGDSFISNDDVLSKIKSDFPTALGVDMEATAIAQVCHLFKIPFIVIRSISDIAGEGNFETYSKFVAKAGEISAKINIKLIGEINRNYSQKSIK